MLTICVGSIEGIAQYQGNRYEGTEGMQLGDSTFMLDSYLIFVAI